MDFSYNDLLCFGLIFFISSSIKALLAFLAFSDALVKFLCTQMFCFFF